MNASATETINEVDFCGKMATAMTAIFATFRDACPFIEARLEGLGSSKSKRHRKDICEPRTCTLRSWRSTARASCRWARSWM